LPRQVLDELNAGTDTGPLNTDTLVLVRISDDPTTPATISVPHDSYIDIPGYGRHKIKSTYGRARTDALAHLTAAGVRGADLTTQADQASRRVLVSAIEQLTGASIDHYAEINLVGFADITDVVGGVPVCLKAPAHDTYSGADLPAGPQTLKGRPAGPRPDRARRSSEQGKREPRAQHGPTRGPTPSAEHTTGDPIPLLSW